MTKSKTIQLKTEKDFQLIDISDEVIKFVKESGIKNGIVNIQTLHTTTGLLVNEAEPLLWEDLEAHFEKIALRTDIYKHDDMSVRTVNICDGECSNGHAHLKASHLAVNVVLNIVDGELQLGRWQRIIYAELDRPRERSYQILVMGE